MARRSSKPQRRAWATEQLTQPPLPELAAHLWQTYHRIRRRRSAAMGIQPIDFTEILAFQRATGTSLSPWDVATIEALDDLYLVARLGAPPEPPEEDS